jgi:hypothetical protein
MQRYRRNRNQDTQIILTETTTPYPRLTKFKISPHIKKGMSCGICGGRNYTETDFPQSILGFPWQPLFPLRVRPDLIPDRCRDMFCATTVSTTVPSSPGLSSDWKWSLFHRSCIRPEHKVDIGISDGLQAGWPGFDSRQGQEIFLYSTGFRVTWGPPSLLFSGFRGAVSVRVTK